MVGIDLYRLKYRTKKGKPRSLESDTASQIRNSQEWDGINKPIYSPGHTARITRCVEIISRLNWWDRLLDLGPMAAPIIRLNWLWLTTKHAYFCELTAPLMKNREKMIRGETVALEITIAGCEYYRDAKTHTDVVRGSWDFPPFKDGSFELVLWSEGPEHSPYPEDSMDVIHKLTSKYIVISAQPALDAFDHHSLMTMERLINLVARDFYLIEDYEIPDNWQIVVGVKQKMYWCGNCGHKFKESAKQLKWFNHLIKCPECGYSTPVGGYDSDPDYIQGICEIYDRCAKE